MEIIFFILSLAASTGGSVAGLGGGVIMKPILDALGTMPIQTINFLSGCTVLVMAIFSYIKGRNDGIKIDYKVIIPLGLGGCVGGVVGKYLFSIIDYNLGLIQSVCLIMISISVLIYVKNRHRIEEKKYSSPVLSFVLGLILGGTSAFLGIGGGQMNTAFLFYFYSLEQKEAAKSSLFIILLAQLTSLGTIVIGGKIPEYSPLMLGYMCLGGCLGGILGGIIRKAASNEVLKKVFMTVLTGLITLNAYNIYTAVINMK